MKIDEISENGNRPPGYKLYQSIFWDNGAVSTLKTLSLVHIEAKETQK